MSWGVETSVRPLTAAEAAFVAEQAAAWHRDLRTSAGGRGREVVVGGAVAYGAAIVGYSLGEEAVAFTGFLMGTFFLVMAVVARRASERLLAQVRGPWSAPEDGWRARDTRVRARSVVAAVSGDEDYAEFLLFEIPGEDWFFLSTDALGGLVDDPGRETPELTNLEPDRVFIASRAEGAQLPRRGAGSGENAYAEAKERGWVWRPREEEWQGNGHGRVAEVDLPGPR